MRAQAGDFDNRHFRCEADALRGLRQRPADFVGGGFSDSAASLADQERNKCPSVMILTAGEKCVSAGDPVHQTVGDQEIQRAVLLKQAFP